MARWWQAALLAALVLATACNSVTAQAEAADDDYADAPVAHLLLRKYIKADFAVSGKNLTIYIDIHNAGSSAAKDVKLSDVLPEGFELAAGSLQTTFPSIDEGADVTHSFVVVPKEGNTVVYLQPASVSYLAEADSKARQVGRSAVIGIFVSSPMQRLQQHLLTAGRYVTLGICRTPADWRNTGLLFGVVGGLLGVNQLVKVMGSSKSSRQRQAALKELDEGGDAAKADKRATRKQQ